jgi:hypothetical protein
MADAKSNYAENLVLDWLLGGSTPTRPSARYLALFHSDPGEASGGTEVTGGSYARQAITFGAASSGSTSNSADISFVNMPSTTATPITHFAVFDAVSSGNKLYYGQLTVSKVTNSGDTLTVLAGQIVISEL